MTDEKILTLHPVGKSGRTINLRQYEMMRQAIVEVLGSQELTHTELFAALEKQLAGKFEGNIGWYGETVKLDLEARRAIERVGKQPERYRLRDEKY